VLSNLPPTVGVGDLLVGHDTNDDAAVLRISSGQAIVQTVDFFTPILDDPFLFGAIAAANAISDVYAMGATPILGLAIAAFPTDRLPLSMLHEILRGGATKAAEAGFPIGGGHTIIDDVPKYGLAVTGTVAIDRVVRNSTALVGDALILTKPLGNGILVNAYRSHSTGGRLRRALRRGSPPDMSEAIRWMTMLNRDAAKAMTDVGVSAATDITGYGLIGHLLEMCNGSAVGADLSASVVPLLPQVRDLLSRGYYPTGSERNAAAFRGSVELQAGENDYKLLSDAQTSGGLLISVPANREYLLRDRFKRDGLFYAKIGVITAQVGRITLRA
jgi:selenium donor protein